MVEACFRSDDYREGQAAFLEKRPPRVHRTVRLSFDAATVATGARAGDGDGEFVARVRAAVFGAVDDHVDRLAWDGDRIAARADRLRMERRSSTRSRSGRSSMRSLAKWTWPSSGTRIPARQWSRVDLIRS